MCEQHTKATLTTPQLTRFSSSCASGSAAGTAPAKAMIAFSANALINILSVGKEEKIGML